MGKKIIHYFTAYNNQPVDIPTIAAKLQIPKKTVQEKLEKLYTADLVYRSSAYYYTFNDICLMRYIKYVYSHDLEGIEEIDLSQQNLFNTLKGRFLEIVVQVTMMKFNHETLDGRWFARAGQIEVPLFHGVDTKHAQGTTTNTYQIDVFGREVGSTRVWLCECKYTQKAMGLTQVKKLERAAQALKQEAREAGIPEPETHLWLVSTGGFTGKAREYIKDRTDIYASDYDGINAIFRAYGGNYTIPLFTAS